MGDFKEFWDDLHELRVQGEGQRIVAYKGYVWLFDDGISGKMVNDIIEKAELGSTDGHHGLSKVDETEEIDSFEFYDDLRSLERSDIIIGSIHNKQLQLLSTGPFVRDPKSSDIIKKLVKHFKLTSVSYDYGDEVAIVKKKQIQGKPSDIVYHGTSLKYLEGILRNGLIPKPQQTNYKNIIHSDKVFFSSRMDEASHHAVTTANNTKSLPVILEIKVPDPALIIPDFDVDRMTGNDYYTDMPVINKNAHTKLPNNKSFSASKEFGVYGYAGKILPMHIKKIYISGNAKTYSLEEYKRYTVKQIRKIIDMYGYLEPNIFLN